MLNLAIPIPSVPGQQDFEIEMTMGGHRQKLHYRVEVVEWSDCAFSAENRVECIRELINSYDEEWVVYNIGAPTDSYVPITFIKSQDWINHHSWLWSKMFVGS